MKIRFWALLTSLAFLGFAVSAAAHPCKHHSGDPDHPHCQDAPGGNANSESNDKVYAVKVVFDEDVFDTSYPSDNVMSDGSGPYIDSVNVTANVPEEGTPPGQFLMWQGGWKNPSSTLFLDFGAAVDCPDAVSGTWGCVEYSPGDTVPCPIPFGARFPENTRCSGFKPVTLNFRHTVDSDPYVFMLDIADSDPHSGEAYGAEMRFDAESNSKSWRLVFKEGCNPNGAGGEFLEITAKDNFRGDSLPNDEWYISTGDGSKTACLTRDGKGNTTIPNGLFEMRFGYTICILADPDSGDGQCLKEPPP